MAHPNTPLAVRIGIQAFAYTVGLAILVGLDRLTGWIGLFH